MTDVTMTMPGSETRLRGITGHYRIHLSGEQTGGALALVEYSFPPGAIGAAPHIHRGHAEHFHVLDGEITFDLDGQLVVMPAGGSLSVPVGAAHGFRNESAAEARCLFLMTPAGYENYFRDMHRALEMGEPLSPENLAVLRARYQTETL